MKIPTGFCGEEQIWCFGAEAPKQQELHQALKKLQLDELPAMLKDENLSISVRLQIAVQAESALYSQRIFLKDEIGNEDKAGSDEIKKRVTSGSIALLQKKLPDHLVIQIQLLNNIIRDSKLDDAGELTPEQQIACHEEGKRLLNCEFLEKTGRVSNRSAPREKSCQAP